MTIRDLLADRRPTLSYELFPPRTQEAETSLWETIAHLATTRPDFASITYGASGTTRTSSRAVVQRLAEDHTIPPLAHLTCVAQSRAEVIAVIEEFMGEGVRDFLALRGDPPEGQPQWKPHPDGLVYAYELVALIREVGASHGVHNISIGVTAFPAQHAQEQWRQQGLDVLKSKQDAGADFAVTQVFYEGSQWQVLADDAAGAGITLPILPGIIALPSANRAVRLEQLTGVAAPASLAADLEQAASLDESRAVGVRAAAALARDLLDRGAPGIHVYTFNRHQAALDLVDQVFGSR